MPGVVAAIKSTAACAEQPLSSGACEDGVLPRWRGTSHLKQKRLVLSR